MRIQSSTTSSDVGPRAFFTPLVPPAGRPYMAHHCNDHLYRINRKQRMQDCPASRGAFLPFLKGPAVPASQELRRTQDKRGATYLPRAANNIPHDVPKTADTGRPERAPKLPAVDSKCPVPPPFPRPSVYAAANRVTTSDFAMRYTPHIHLQQTLNLRGLR